MFVELIRLAVVVLATAASFETMNRIDTDGSALLVATAVGAGVGYVVGGILGRFAQGRIIQAERRLQAVSASEIIAGGAGMMSGLLLAAAVTWPVLLFDAKLFTVPIAAVVLTVAAWLGLRIGRSRAGDMLRFVGAGGRLPARGSRAMGATYKLVDSSALIDARVLQIARCGFVEGVLVVPEFVLFELQGLADSGEPDRRRRGQRGLETVTALQQLSSVGLEVLEDDPPPSAVDAKLLHLAKARGLALMTTDVALSRIAEVQGVKVLDVNQLAEGLRPPVLPGDSVSVHISKQGREKGQGVGYLPDGTLVIVERASDAVGSTVGADVTSIMSNAKGRMVFGTRRDRPRLVHGEADSAS